MTDGSCLVEYAELRDAGWKHIMVLQGKCEGYNIYFVTNIVVALIAADTDNTGREYILYLTRYLFRWIL